VALTNLKKGVWEFGAMTDISDNIGIPGNSFLLNIHAHFG
jgi:hypothetical protein